MIIGRLSESLADISIGRNVASGISWLAKADLARLDLGTHKIDGDNLFCIISEYQTRVENGCALESHRKYIDIHCVIDGTENIGYTSLTDQVLIRPYNEEHDYALYEGESSLLAMTPGMFTVFFPTDLHMSGISNVPVTVRKAVMKVRITS